MTNDLHYFYESDFAKGNLVDFRNSLPSHVRPMFVASMGGMSILDRDYTNVIQGYEGHKNNKSITGKDSTEIKPICGIQEIRYRWGVSKHLNWVPIIGSIVYASARAHGDTAWHSLYFDSATEECLSHDKNIAASKLNQKGIEPLGSGKFLKAKNYFSNAYHYSNSTNFANSKDATALAVEGQNLLNSGKFAEATTQFAQAWVKSDINELKSKLLNYYSEARKAAIDKAVEIHEEARSLHNNQGEAAFMKYNEAIALNKNVAVYHNNKAIVLVGLGRAQEPLDATNEALRIDGSYKIESPFAIGI